MKFDRGNGDHRDEKNKKKKTGTQAGISAAVIIHDIKAVIDEQTAIVAEGKSLADAINDFPKKQQIISIINLLNTELENSTDRLEELIACFSSA